MQTAKARGSPKESPQKVSARPARQLKINPVEPSSSSPSSNATAKTPNRSPKVIERRSPRSPISEKKRPSKLSELESQISKLHDDLKKVKDQLVASESVKKEAQETAEESKRQLADVSLKLEENQKQLCQLLASKEENIVDLQNISEEKEHEWKSQIESVRQQHSADSAALASALEEIERLKLHLEKVTESGDVQVEQSETAAELQSLKDNLTETLLVLEIMKQELKDSRVSEAQAQDLVRETLLQLEAAKETVNALRSDVNRSTEAYNAVVSELEQSKARVTFLEGVVKGLNADLMNLSSVNSLESVGDQILPDVNQLQIELQAAKSDARQLKSALEAAEIRYNEECSHSSTQIGNASELLEQMKMQSRLREAELEVELKNASASIEELKANLMDKETELQGISDENDSLNLKLEKSMACQREQEVENELKRLREDVADLRSNLMDKETELQNISEENEILKLEISKHEMDKSVENDQVAAEVDASRAAEQDAVTKLGYMMEEVDKSNRKAARVVEQLEAAQTANSEMEAELRRLKVQSDQWRKAAEAAASMLSPGSNGKYVERTGSLPLDNKYSPIGGRHSSPYMDDYDDDSFKKKNGNVLKKIGVLWKKPQK
ncbi:interactor of constitutive active ROPs 3-like [Chenopodium quinoa]|uniref:interactor of constitutive active ROPs 3-like n=1 Tax=Chenopodium quinoa TaxID=63459 RepID=UPI000B79A161|nr:interactor of constitutive active ROPs 3-like [Chenopodium quinoa]XP_021745933.1 interactor of constitutive active ROPs 3-like [Chenopodium quinoa]XP_021745934.1 interactor of constitutive active ROPs 3-like [Chenopodium quinoa]XP_021745935.1 interactor of constitutive active ROPs 3-like [Chenopodium quinoa]XP_021745936.1 interactor of constitutive active ROPs 3-like [Chenopodium quinoa]XP_021745937.1 interactor of constitutive active ROPs 3-like [Chenopodium quinoa]